MQLSNNKASVYLFIFFSLFKKFTFLSFIGIPEIICPFGRGSSQRSRERRGQ